MKKPWLSAKVFCVVLFFAKESKQKRHPTGKHLHYRYDGRAERFAYANVRFNPCLEGNCAYAQDYVRQGKSVKGDRTPWGSHQPTRIAKQKDGRLTILLFWHPHGEIPLLGEMSQSDKRVAVP